MGDEGFSASVSTTSRCCVNAVPTVLMVTHRSVSWRTCATPPCGSTAVRCRNWARPATSCTPTLRQSTRRRPRPDARPSAPVSEETAGPTRIGSGGMRVTNVEFRRADGSASGFLVEGSVAASDFSYEASVDLSPVTAGIGIFSENGVNVAGPNTGRSGSRHSGGHHREFTMPSVILRPGHYTLTTVLLDGGKMIDGIERGFSFNRPWLPGQRTRAMYLEGDWLQTRGNDNGGAPSRDYPEVRTRLWKPLLVWARTS